VVIAIDGGLSTPIIRGAESKSVWEISSEVKELSARAAKNRLKLSEIQGGSFSVSNLGMYGVDQFDAIINPPQCAILAVGQAKPRWVVSKEGEARVATVMQVTLSADHRAIDGATAARFLLAWRRRVEEPECLASVTAKLHQDSVSMNPGASS
jgi:pyruvate dehydrogenase E2 component (dihydrolipoamide acetyltransferase)